MGTSKHSKHMPEEQYNILKKAGKITGLLDKPFDQYKAVDEHELSLVFDTHLVDPTVRANQNVPEIDIDSPPDQSSPKDGAAAEVGVKVSFNGKKGKK